MPIQPRKYKYDLKSPGHKPKNQAGTISRSGKPRFPWAMSEISGSASSIDSLHTPSSPNPDLTMVSSPKPSQLQQHHHASDDDDNLAAEASQFPEEHRTNDLPLPPKPPKDQPPPLPPKDNPLPPKDNLLPLPPRSKTPPNLRSETSIKNSIPLPPKEPMGKNLLPLPPKGGGGTNCQHGRHSVPSILNSDLLTGDKAPPLPPKAKISS